MKWNVMKNKLWYFIAISINGKTILIYYQKIKSKNIHNIQMNGNCGEAENVSYANKSQSP